MASYPGAVKTFTTKNSGDTIQPADVNDLQNEVNAIEAGLLNGTANLQSSASTVATLSVLGASTFVGAVTFSTTVTFSASQNPKVYLNHSAASQIANNSLTGLNWDTIISDPTGMHSTSVNSSRITFVSSTGLYLVGGSIVWQNQSSAGGWQARLFLNDTSYILIDSRDGAQGNAKGHAIAGMVRAASTTDYVTFVAYQNSGSTASLSSGVDANFWAVKV